MPTQLPLPDATAQLQARKDATALLRRAEREERYGNRTAAERDRRAAYALLLLAGVAKEKQR